MPQIIEENEQDDIEVIATRIVQRRHQRETLTSLLPDIALEVTAALETACLQIPIFFTIPKSGDSRVMFITPFDPSDADWSTTCKLVCGIVEKKIGMKNLIARDVAYVAAGMRIETAAADGGARAVDAT